MSADRLQNVERIYLAARELESTERNAYLSETCADDAELRREVESLLVYDKRAESFLETSAIEMEARSQALAEEASLVGVELGSYRILALIERGGMGDVYRARDERLNRDVAVKVLPREVSLDVTWQARFRREAKAIAAPSHPNVLALYDFGNERGIWFTVTELLQGETLRQRLQQAPTPSWREAAAFGIGIAQGLHATHAQGIVHRDLKPENIFLTVEGRVVLLDFGLAKWIEPMELTSDPVTVLTAPGDVLGTLGYMSPERISRARVGATSDIFSLGCVLYESISGGPPFNRESRAETMAAILGATPPALDTRSPIDSIVARCLEKEPESRFQHAGDVAAALLRVLETGYALT